MPASRQRARVRSLAERGEVLVQVGEGSHSDPAQTPDQAAEADDARRHVRVALDRMPERERRMLLMHAEGYSYRDIAAVLELNEASVGVLLARARRAFRETYEDAFDAP